MKAKIPNTLKSKPKGKSETSATARAALASPDPWMRFARGGELAMSIERGREQEALWLLDDGVKPPQHLLTVALGSAAHQGMGALCWRLVSMGASISFASPPGCSVRDAFLGSVASLGFLGERWPPAMLSLLAGQTALARQWETRHGRSCFGSDFHKSKGLLAVAFSAGLRGVDREWAMSLSVEPMGAKERAKVANILCLAGFIDDAMALLESSPSTERAKIARSMAAPLCGYAPTDSSKARALIALERVVELCEGKLAPALAPWSCQDLDRLSDGQYSRVQGEARLGAIASLVSSRSCWPDPDTERSCASWPRWVALAARNHEAMRVMEPITQVREEMTFIKAGSALLLAVLDKRAEPSSMPTLNPSWSPSSSTPWSTSQSLLRAPPGCDPREAALEALALSESMELGVIAKESEERRAREEKKRAKSTGHAEPLPVKPLPRARHRL